MKRKFLDNIGITSRPDTWNKKDRRQKRWRKERSIYSFDERETWNLYETFYYWLYERLKMYKERASRYIDLEYHRFQIRSETLTHLECIDRMLEGIEIFALTSEDERSETQQKKVDDIVYIWSKVYPAMWW